MIIKYLIKSRIAKSPIKTNNDFNPIRSPKTIQKPIIQRNTFFLVLFISGLKSTNLDSNIEPIENPNKHPKALKVFELLVKNKLNNAKKDKPI